MNEPPNILKQWLYKEKKRKLFLQRPRIDAPSKAFYNCSTLLRSLALTRVYSCRRSKSCEICILQKLLVRAASTKEQKRYYTVEQGGAQRHLPRILSKVSMPKAQFLLTSMAMNTSTSTSKAAVAYLDIAARWSWMRSNLSSIAQRSNRLPRY